MTRMTHSEGSAKTERRTRQPGADNNIERVSG